MLLGFAFLFIIAFLLINPPENKKVDPKAEAMIVLTWPDENYDDIDLWLKLPNGDAVGYRSIDREYVHLERDDLGISNDIIQLPDGSTKVNKMNREVIIFRQLIEGHYVVNLYFFKDKDDKSIPAEVGPELLPAPVPCRVTIIQLNPKYKELASFLVVMDKEDQEKTVIQFDIENNKFKNFIQAEEKFVSPTGTSAGSYWGGSGL